MEPAASLGSLQQLRCVRAAAEHGSFAAAADQLGLTQPAVADHVRRLEGALGTRLFQRHARGVRLTEAGTAFDDHLRIALQSIDRAVATVSDLDALRAGTLSFGLPATPEAYGIELYVSEFSRRHPGVRLRLLGRNSSAAADRVREGSLEAALVSLPIDDRDLEIDPIAHDEIVYVSCDPGAVSSPVSIEQVAERRLVVYDAEAGDRDPIRRQLAARAQEAGLRLAPRVEAETMVMALRLVLDGVGDTYLPRTHTRAAGFPGSLHLVGFDPPMTDVLAIVRRAGIAPSPAVARFADGLRQHLVARLADDPPAGAQSRPA